MNAARAGHRRESRRRRCAPTASGWSARATGGGSRRSSRGSRRGRLRQLSDEDVLALPVLYRTVASSLAVARETSLDAATLAYLEALVQRAWFLVYGPRATLGAGCGASSAAAGARRCARSGSDLLIALAVMVAGTVVGWLLVARGPGMVLTRWSQPVRRRARARRRAARRCAGRSSAHAQRRRADRVRRLPVQQQRAGLDPRLRAGLRVRHPDAAAAGPEHGDARARCCGCYADAGLLAGVRRLAVGPRHDRAVRDPAGGRGGAAHRAGDGVPRRARGAGGRGARRAAAPRRSWPAWC